MKNGMKAGLGMPGSCVLNLRVSANSVRNIRNNDKRKKKHQINQCITWKFLFRNEWNNLEYSGTESFLHVPRMFRFSRLGPIRRSLSAMRLTADIQKKPFQSVPDGPEHFSAGESPEWRGLQTFTPGVVPDVPDAPGRCAGFCFSRSPFSSQGARHGRAESR